MAPRKKTLGLISAVIGLAFGFACAAGASTAVSSANTDDMPEYTFQSASETALPVHIKPGKPQTVHVDRDVGHVTIDGPRKNVSAFIYDSRSVILFPHGSSGGAHFTIYGKDGKPFMERYAVIGDPEKKYIRLHQTCANGSKDPSCEKTAIYFCPNLCYETRMVSAAPQPVIPQ